MCVSILSPGGRLKVSSPDEDAEGRLLTPAYVPFFSLAPKTRVSQVHSSFDLVEKIIKTRLDQTKWDKYRMTDSRG